MNKRLFLTIFATITLTPLIASAWPFGHHHGGGFFGSGWNFPFFGSSIVEPVYVQSVVERPIIQEVKAELGEATPINLTNISPTINENNQYVYTFAIPGHRKRDVKVTASKRKRTIHVLIQGKKSKNSDTETNGVHIIASSSSSQNEERIFTPPADSDLNNIIARVRKGMLTITLNRTGQAVNVVDGDNE